MKKKDLSCSLWKEAEKIFMTWSKKDLVGYIREFSECKDLVQFVREQEVKHD